ncbi:hypothetical protein [Sinomonas sp. G460-2]|uniref:hypothetical protein n=1 Tax=Sinomonas sp. G460-2 TaxID=3393464 RepID=UPI0039EFD93E
MAAPETSAQTIRDWAYETLADLGPLIAHLETTGEDTWQTDVVRSEDSTRKCFFGHVHAWGGDDTRGSALWEAFEELWSTTYRIYTVNDGSDPGYHQPTPKERILAYLGKLQSGEEPTTHESMEAEYQRYPAEDETEA